MKILYISPGVAPYRDSLFNLLGERCSVDVIYEASSSESKIRNKDWFTDDFENYNAFFPKKINVLGKKLLPAVWKYILFGQYDVIIIGMYSSVTQVIGIILLKLFRRKYLINSDGGFIKPNESGKARFCKRFLISGATGYFASGKATAQYLEYYGATPDRIHIYPFSSYLESDLPKEYTGRGQKKELKNELGLCEDYIVISIGQFVHRKGFDILMESAKQISHSVGIYIIGSDPPDEYTRHKEKNNLTNVHFLPFMKKEILIKYYQAADLYVMPTREDIWGLVINEAMSQGLPVISSDKCLAALELVEDGVNGYIVPVENPQAMADKISYLSENPKLSESIGCQNMEKMKNYTIEAMAERFYEVLNSIAGEDKQ